MSWGSFFKNVVEAVAPTPQALSGLRASGSAPEPAPSHGYRVLKVADPVYPPSVAQDSSTGADHASASADGGDDAKGKKGRRNAKSDSGNKTCPAAQAGLEPFYDFITAVDGIELTSDGGWLSSYARSGAQDLVSATVFSIKGQYRRVVQLPPQALTGVAWGVHLRWSPVQPALDNVFHVLDVVPHSPAWQAGLLEEEDYIIGTPSGIVRGESGLSELFQDHLDRELQLWVWNRYTDVTRLLALTPSRHWSAPGASVSAQGRGTVGCGIGYGALHRLPRPLGTGPPPGEGDTVFATRESVDLARFQSLADLAQPPQPADVGEVRAPGAQEGRSRPGRRAKYVPPEALDQAQAQVQGQAAGQDGDGAEKSKAGVSTGPPPKAGAANATNSTTTKPSTTAAAAAAAATSTESSAAGGGAGAATQGAKSAGLSEADIDAMLAEADRDSSDDHAGGSDGKLDVAPPPPPPKGKASS